MPAYAVFEVIPEPDPDGGAVARYGEYKAAVPDLIARHGGRYLARAAPPETLEGSPSVGRWHLVEFPDGESARAFWADPDYLALKPLRSGAADVRAVLLDPGSS